MPPCPLCAGPAGPYFEDGPRRWTYRRCLRCALVFRDGELARADERRRYEQHQNHPGQQGYLDFLEPMASAIVQRCAPACEGLDYGCGPGPVLALMLGERGMRMALYDPFFAPDEAALRRQYDFVTCTEAAEHFREPARDFGLLAGLLRPGGWLGLMTSFLPEDDRQFASWHYRLDPTHIRFYSGKTLEWLAAAHGWRLKREGAQLALFQKL